MRFEIPSLFCFVLFPFPAKPNIPPGRTTISLSATFSSTPPTSLIPRRLPPLPTSSPVPASAPHRQIRRNPSLALCPAYPHPAPLLPCAPPPPPRVCSRRGGEDPSHGLRARRREDADRGRMRCCVSRVSSAGCRAMGVAGRANPTSSLRSRRCLRMRPSYAPFSEPFTERPAPAAPSSPAAAPRA